jgi:RNA polymerase sigma-70 factor (ECF subfamily)
MLNQSARDDELIAHIQRDDARALKLLFERYYSSLCVFALRILKRKDLCEEAVSDVFTNIWLRRGKIEITSSVKSYLFAAVRNQSLNYLQANRPHGEELHVVDAERDALRADDFLLYKELEEEIGQLLQSLPERRQLIFRLCRFEGLSYKEIADLLSISIHTVQNQMVHAVKFLSSHYPRLLK